MRALAFILFFVLLILWAISVKKSSDQKKVLYWFGAILLMCFAGFREIGIDQDSVGYMNYYELGDLMWVITEPTFGVISEFTRYVFSNFKYVLLIYAIIGVWLKFAAINRLTNLEWLTVTVYFSTFFLLHEFTQIRAGIASGIFLLAITPLIEKQRIKYLALILLASLFHYSAFILLILVFLSNNRLNKIWKIALASAIPLGILLHYAKFNPLIVIPIETIRVKMEIYQGVMENSSVSLNVFNLVYLVKYIIFYILLLFYDTIYDRTKNVSILLKIYALSLFSYLALSGNTTISMRISELLGVVEIILIPYLCFIFKPRYFGVIMVVIIALIYLIINIYSLDLIYSSPKLN